MASRLGKKTIELNEISKSYGDKKLIEDFTYILLPEDRIGIIGPNGCGKSTLLNIITGKIQADKGLVEVGTTVKIGYFSQENEYMDEKLRVIDYVRETAEYIQTSEGTITAAQMCEKFLFTGSMQYSLISKLSGGEKRRLYLLKVLMDAPNILVLDEPTNDLDIQTLTILEDYLETYPGIVVTVSHDRYFLDKIATRIFSFERNGVIDQYEGNFSDYKIAAQGQEKNNEQDYSYSKTTEKKSASMETWKQRAPKLKFSYREQREYETIDEDIAKLELEIEEVDREIEKSSTNYSKLNELMENKEKLEKALEEKMERWVYLNDLAEQIEAAKNK